MNKIILCEGETDAILLSYYLGKVAGWKFCKKPPANIAIKPDAFEQSVNWYEKGDDRLLICAVGGKSSVRSFFKEKVLRPVVDAGAFSRIALVLDRDESEIKSIEDHASSVFKPVISTMRNNEWIPNKYTDAYGTEQMVEGLLVVIPTEHEGALETLMLDSIAEDPSGKHKEINTIGWEVWSSHFFFFAGTYYAGFRFVSVDRKPVLFSKNRLT